MHQVIRITFRCTTMIMRTPTRTSHTYNAVIHIPFSHFSFFFLLSSTYAAINRLTLHGVFSFGNNEMVRWRGHTTLGIGLSLECLENTNKICLYLMKIADLNCRLFRFFVVVVAFLPFSNILTRHSYSELSFARVCLMCTCALCTAVNTSPIDVRVAALFAIIFDFITI